MQEIKQDFEYFDIDDRHMYAGAQAFLDHYQQHVELKEFLEFFNKELPQYLTIPEKLLTLLNLHDSLDINLGQALYATHFRLLNPEMELACHASVGIRVISALASKDEEILKFMINDPCYLVRLAVYENSNTPKDLIEYVKPDDTFFREFKLDEMEELGEDYEEMASVESCSCSPDGLADFIHEKWNNELLELPPIAHEFEHGTKCL